MKEMEYAVIVALAMVGIIAVQIGLTYLFTFRVGEIFSQTAMGPCSSMPLCGCAGKGGKRRRRKKRFDSEKRGVGENLRRFFLFRGFPFSLGCVIL